MRWLELKKLSRSVLLSGAALAALYSSAIAQSPPGDRPPSADEPRPGERREEQPPRPREEPVRPTERVEVVPRQRIVPDRPADPPPRPREEPTRKPRPDGRIEDTRRDYDRYEDVPDDMYFDRGSYAPRRPGDGPQYGFDDGGRQRPADVRSRSRPNGPPPEEMDRIRRDDPEMFKLVEQDRDLERECANMAEQIRQQPNKEASSEARKKLAELVKMHFDVRQKQRELRLQRLEAELKRVKEAVEARQAQAEQIIKRRLNELTGEADDISF